MTMNCFMHFRKNIYGLQIKKKGTYEIAFAERTAREIIGITLLNMVLC